MGKSKVPNLSAHERETPLFTRIAVFAALLLGSLTFGVANAQSCNDLNGAIIGSQETSPTYLGFFGNQFASESVMNIYGTYGSQYNALSVRNPYGSYGSDYGSYSAFNPYTVLAPQIWKHGVLLGYLTANTSLPNDVYLPNVDAQCAFSASAPAPWWPAIPVPIGATDNLRSGPFMAFPRTSPGSPKPALGRGRHFRPPEKMPWRRRPGPRSRPAPPSARAGSQTTGRR